MSGGSNKTIFRKVYFGVLVYIAIGLPLSRSALTQGMILLVVLWLWSDFQGSVVLRFFKQKGLFRGFFLLTKYLWALAKESIVEKTGFFLRNKPAVIFASIYLLGVIGLIFTGNFPRATHALRIKLPLLLFPLVFSTTPPLDKKEFKTLLRFYVAAILAGTLIGSIKMITGNYVNVREFSPFISPVRFGLNITFGVFVLLYFIARDKNFSVLTKIFMTLLVVWFIWFLTKMESVTSLGIMFAVSLGILVYLTFQIKKRGIRLAVLSVIVLVPVIFIFYIKNEVTRMTHVSTDQIPPASAKTARGNPYVFDTVHYGIEDGRYVGAYLCLPELKQAWNRRSRIPFNGKDKNGNLVKTTLIRYLTSKNLKKDAEGVAQLTEKDIRNIENGIANVHYINHPGLHSRLLVMIKGWQVYQKTGKAGGNSALQRYAYLRAAVNVIRRNFWTGVGTGDLWETLGHEYLRIHLGLEHYVGYPAHNQYVDTFVSFGVFGFIWFVFALVYPPVKTNSFRNYFFVVFYAIMLLSMLSDDTMETHAGVTLFSFFLSMFMFGMENKEEYG